MTEQLTEWVAVYRLDFEESFTTDTFSYFLPTQDLSKAAEMIQKDIGDNTLIELRRVM